MISNFMIMMQISFGILYLAYICLIIIFMSKNLKNVSDNEEKTAKNIRLAFLSLLIGDLGHVGARLLILFAENPNSYYGIFGIGGLLEMIGLIFLFILFHS